jgi:hypothetical protein
MTSLMDILKEQSSFGFTGKVNVLLQSTGQFLGVIYQSEGQIVGAEFAQYTDKKALFKMIFEDVDGHNKYKFVVEPEVVSPDKHTFLVTFEDLKKDAETHYSRYQATTKLRPAPNLKLVIDPEIIVNNLALSPNEYDVLSILAEWCTVSDIYKYSKLMEFEVTDALVNLRKKRAIKVFGP